MTVVAGAVGAPMELDLASASIAALSAAIDALARRIAPLKVEVFVPLYANTFALATAAKRACALENSIMIRDYDWNWSKSEQPPPFQSSRLYQLFFATEAEFTKIHAAGISFFAVPISVFHPKYIFLGPDENTAADDPDFLVLRKALAKALTSRRLLAKSFADNIWKAFNLIWVSDIPDQVELLAGAIEERLRRPELDKPLVNFWKSRSIQRALGASPRGANDGAIRAVKAFIWGGPLASVAKSDAQISQATTAKQRRQHGLLRLRDPSRPTYCIELPSLGDAFSPQEIREKHVLYCCVGFKEDRRLRDYYTKNEQQSDKTPWHLSSRKYAAYNNPDFRLLITAIQEMFDALFAAAQRLSGPNADNGPADIFDELVADYDKYCRTANPIAQLYTRDAYVTCLKEHHDAHAFRRVLGSLSASPPV